MTITCELPECTYPDCLCAPCLDVRILVPSRADSIKNATVKLSFRGGTPKQALAHVRVAIKALQDELDAGEIHHDPRTDHERKIDALRSALSALDTRDPALHRLLAERNIIVRSLDGGSTPFRPDGAFPESEYPREASDLERAEQLWRELQEDNLGGYSGINRPFWIKLAFTAVRREAESAPTWDDAVKALLSADAGRKLGHHTAVEIANYLAANKPGAATDG
jgi:hypothetical protein